MTATLTPPRSPSRVAAIILGDPCGHRADIIEALDRYAFRHTTVETADGALRKAQSLTNSLLVVAAADVAGRPELAASPPGRRTIVVAEANDDRASLPETIAAILDADEAAAIEGVAEVLQTVAREVAYSRRRDTMLRWLERESERDAITGLRTRQAFQTQLEGMCAASEANGEPVCVIVVDVPTIRAAQEAYGGATAAALLHSAAQAVVRSIRITDVAGRLSLDTFGIALPGASLDTGRRIARRILQSLERQSTTGELDPGISLGFGVAAGARCTAAELLEAAGRQVAHAHRSYPGSGLRPIDSDGPSVA